MPLFKILREMAKHPISRPSDRKSNTTDNLKEKFLSHFDGDQHTRALELLDLARVSYQLRDDDNIYLGRIEAQYLAAAEAAGLLDDGIVTRTDLEQLLLTQGLSTGGSGDGFSGDGDGLALVARVVDQVHGGMRIDSLPGSGTSVSISVPSSLALQDVLLVRCAGMRWGVPKAA